MAEHRDTPALLALVLDRVRDIVLLLEGSGRVRTANAAGRLRGWKPGDRVLDVVEETDQAELEAAWNRLLERPGQTFTVEVRLRGDSPERSLVLTAENLVHDPMVAGVVVTGTDRAEIDATQVRLQQAQRLEAIGRLAGGIAHDLNNSLTTIHGMSALSLDDPDLPASVRADLGEVLKAAENATTMTRRLLAFSRRQLLRPKHIDVNRQLAGALKSITRLLGEDVDVVVDTSARDGTAFVDPAQLEQVVLNLALNSRDALPAGGSIVLRTRDVHVESGESSSAGIAGIRPGDYLGIDVSDDGPGVPEHLRQRVFEPFFTTKSSQHGAGLGLSTVYGIIKQSGGYVWIGEADGGGALVSILLPRADLSAPSANSRDTVASEHGGTVLIAEDDTTVRFVARRVLAGRGYTVLEAANGTQAIEICGSYTGRIDLLLTDVMMPGLGGREVAERCRAERPDMAVLYMSGYQDDSILRRGVGTGAAELVEKPFQPDELARRVRERIASHKAHA